MNRESESLEDISSLKKRLCGLQAELVVLRNENSSSFQHLKSFRKYDESSFTKRSSSQNSTNNSAERNSLVRQLMDICQNIQCIQKRVEQIKSKEESNGKCICRDGCSCISVGKSKQNSSSSYSHEKLSSSRLRAQSSQRNSFMCPSCIRDASICSAPTSQEEPIKIQCIYCGDLFSPQSLTTVDKSPTTAKENDCKFSNSLLGPCQAEAPCAPPCCSRNSGTTINSVYNENKCSTSENRNKEENETKVICSSAKSEEVVEETKRNVTENKMKEVEKEIKKEKISKSCSNKLQLPFVQKIPISDNRTNLCLSPRDDCLCCNSCSYIADCLPPSECCLCPRKHFFGHSYCF